MHVLLVNRDHAKWLQFERTESTQDEPWIERHRREIERNEERYDVRHS